MAQTMDKPQSYGKRLIDDIRHQPMIYLMALPVIAFYVVFHHSSWITPRSSSMSLSFREMAQAQSYRTSRQESTKF